MDKLKQTFSRNKDTSEATESAGKGSGQGSHFPGNDDLGSTVTGQRDTPGTRDVAAAQGTTGPEAGGDQHVGTVSAGSQAPSTAAIGQTSTYSSHRLGKGDPTGSVADPQSTDPISYQKPETATIGDAGVPEGSAQIAATKALEKLPGMPGGYPDKDYTNPYKAEHLDPRVDGLPIRSKETGSSGGSGTAAAAAGSALAGGTVGTLASKPQSSSTSAPATTPAPSGLTSTTNPSDRHPTYSEAERDHGTTAAATGTSQQTDSQASGFVGKALAAVGLGGAAGAAAGAAADRDHKDSAIADTTPSSSIPQPSHSRKESIPTTAYPGGVSSPAPINAPVGGTREAARQDEPSDSHRGTAAAAGAGLGAAGLGAAAASHGSASEPATYHDATTRGLSSGQDTSYSGPGSTQLSQPTGTTSTPTTLASNEPYSSEPDRSKRNAALAGAGGAALGGGAAYAATRDSKQDPSGYTIHGPDSSATSTQPRTSAVSQPPTTSTQPAFTTTHPGASSATPLVPASAGAPPTARESGLTDKDDDHTGRNAALAGTAGAGALGAGAYGLHEHNKRAEDQPASGGAVLGPAGAGTPYTARESDQKATQLGPAAAGIPYTARDDHLKDRDDDHTGRNAALAGAAGAGAVGAGAYGVHEHNEKEAEKARKEAEKEQKEAAKHAEKEEKKHQKEVEKEEKKHQKEVEKAEKKHEKEVEKAEKKHEKEVAKEEKKQEKEAEKLEKKHSKDAGAAVVTPQSTHETTRGDSLESAESQHARELQEYEAERRRKADHAKEVGGVALVGGAQAGIGDRETKPGLLKRIFKRRKNKDTGADEEYSTDEEDSSKGDTVVPAALGAGAAYGAYSHHDKHKHDDTSNIGTAHTTDTATTEPQTKYEAVSGGAVKPSYNPLSKDPVPGTTTSATTKPGSAALSAGTSGRAPVVDAAETKAAQPSRHTEEAALAGGAGALAGGAAARHHDTTDPTYGTTSTTSGPTSTGYANEPYGHTAIHGPDTSAASTQPAVGTTSSSTHPEAVTTNPVAARTAEKALNDPNDNRDRHIEPTLGIPYDPAKDPAAAQRLDERSAQHLAEDKSATTPQSSTSHQPWREGYNTHETPSSPTTSSTGTGEKKSLTQKLKEKITGHKDEPEHVHGEEHGVLHKKPHQVPEDVRGSYEGSR
ncbi:uncharacterized protein AB675_11671 [Cyphellophora attinorum]|uniref:Uncharacterized protein n=1 Tax=Cyphellophora attinorum TaxID=1664694 RepID=A0A0N0NIF5_9EURO|nr:uncharacterized protein AB675_11671 [Phialophora attinorum]KPI35379.1 hypothetical protein AB675_11671 [Phialophora attinorum]